MSNSLSPSLELNEHPAFLHQQLTYKRVSQNPPEQGSCHCIGSILLVLVVLDDNAFLEQGSMLGVMLVAVIGVHSMGHVSAD